MKTFMKKIIGGTMLSVSLLNCGAAQRRDATDVFNQWVDQKGSFYQCIFNDLAIPGKHQEAFTPGFIDYLKTHGLASEQLNEKEQTTHFTTIISQHKKFMRKLFAHENKTTENETLFAIANHFFEYCFSSATWPNFHKILKTPQEYPIARLLYSTMWYNLAGEGWKNWHGATLSKLQEKCAHGDCVTYIAGGTDIYQLLDYGIYSIKVIDPMLPTQPAYYTEGWDWLVFGALNDELTIKTKTKNLLLKRTTYQETGKFHAGDSGELTQSITQWLVYDQDTNRQLGSITYERRFCKQEDFCTTPGQHLLMSFNELYFLTTVDDDNWGINPKKLPKDFVMHIKQLRTPVTRDTLCNMQKADASNFCFIRLGSSAV